MVFMRCYLDGYTFGREQSLVARRGLLIRCRDRQPGKRAYCAPQVARRIVEDRVFLGEAWGPTRQFVKAALVGLRGLEDGLWEFGGCWCFFGRKGNGVGITKARRTPC